MTQIPTVNCGMENSRKILNNGVCRFGCYGVCGLNHVVEVLRTPTTPRFRRNQPHRQVSISTPTHPLRPILEMPINPVQRQARPSHSQKHRVQESPTREFSPKKSEKKSLCLTLNNKKQAQIIKNHKSKNSQYIQRSGDSGDSGGFSALKFLKLFIRLRSNYFCPR